MKEAFSCVRKITSKAAEKKSLSLHEILFKSASKVKVEIIPEPIYLDMLSNKKDGKKREREGSEKINMKWMEEEMEK